MKKTEYDNMAFREQTYWWHVGRLRIIDTILHKYDSLNKNNRILNIGCGTGGTVETLAKFGKVTNVDVSDDAIKYMKKKGYKNIVKVEDIALPFNDTEFDLICAYDVLEHIKNDNLALNEWRRVLTDDGLIMITVPAYKWLWSGHDESLHHFRRYTKDHLAAIAQNVGLEPVRVSYAIAFSLPLIVLFRSWNKLIKKDINSEASYVNVPHFVNGVFIRVLFAEATLHKYINIPFGTSVVGVFKKAKNYDTKKKI